MRAAGGLVAERPSSLKPSPASAPSPWTGPTYYGRPALKPAPFHKSLVGGYIFLAGLSGAASLIGLLAGLVGRGRFEALRRRARLLALLAPTIGSGLLVLDLHTPKRFYNMLRIFKPRSPMSIGTWILLGFSGAAVPAAALAAVAERAGLPLPGRLAALAEAPAGAAGAGLSVYTAGLLSATSAPAWAAAPGALAVRFAASSAAAGASALTIGAADETVRRALSSLAAGALAVELAAAGVQSKAYEAAGIAAVEQTGWGRAERIVAIGLGAGLPLALFGAARLMDGGSRLRRRVEDVAAVLALLGSLGLRVTALGVGAASADSPHIAFRFAQADNLPETRAAARGRGRGRMRALGERAPPSPP